MDPVINRLKRIYHNNLAKNWQLLGYKCADKIRALSPSSLTTSGEAVSTYSIKEFLLTNYNECITLFWGFSVESIALRLKYLIRIISWTFTR